MTVDNPIEGDPSYLSPFHAKGLGLGINLQCGAPRGVRREHVGARLRGPVCGGLRMMRREICSCKSLGSAWKVAQLSREFTPGGLESFLVLSLL